jgi:hypothetical protein
MSHTLTFTPSGTTIRQTNIVSVVVTVSNTDRASAIAHALAAISEVVNEKTASSAVFV